MTLWCALRRLCGSGKTSPERDSLPAAVARGRLSYIIKTRLCWDLLNPLPAPGSLEWIYPLYPPRGPVVTKGDLPVMFKGSPCHVLHLTSHTVFWGRVSTDRIRSTSRTKTKLALFPIVPGQHCSGETARTTGPLLPKLLSVSRTLAYKVKQLLAPNKRKRLLRCVLQTR